jgi:hypothetical protein
MPAYHKKTNQIKPGSLDLIIIADYNDDTAANEVVSHLRQNDPDNLFMQPRIATVPPFNTIATAFSISQFALHNQHERLIIFSNTAPRGKNPTKNKNQKAIPWKGNEEQFLALTHIPTSNPKIPYIPVFFVHSAFNSSLIKNHTSDLWKVNVPNVGTQFRSRDIYIKAVADYIYGKPITAEKIDIRTIPDFPTNRVCFVDGYGNIKTTKRKQEWPKELNTQEKIYITINGITHLAYNRLTQNGNREQDKFYIQTGSSGAIDNPFIEIILLMGNAAEAFKIPQKYNEEITITFSPKK